MESYSISLPARASVFVEAVTLGKSQTIAVPLPLVHLLGDWPAAAFLAQCMFHASQTGGSFARTHADWERELNLSADQVRRCLRTCAGIIKVERRGIPARNVYSIDYPQLASRLATLQPVAGVVHSVKRDVPATSDRETPRPVVQGSPQQSSYKKLKEQPKKKDDVRQSPSNHQQVLTRLLATWNTHRGPLPEATGLTAPRQQALFSLLRDSGGEVEVAVSVLTDATREVARDAFWQEKRFGLDTLLPRVQGRAEAWRSRQKIKDDIQKIPVWVVGERVSYRREGYDIEHVTKTFIDLFDEVNGSVRLHFNSDDIRAVRAVIA